METLINLKKLFFLKKKKKVVFFMKKTDYKIENLIQN